MVVTCNFLHILVFFPPAVFSPHIGLLHPGIERQKMFLDWDVSIDFCVAWPLLGWGKVVVLCDVIR